MDLLYWKDATLPSVIKTYNCIDKYIIFEPWHGGFNNIRMTFELVCVLAFRLNRILVLPNPYRITHLANTNGFDTFFDINDIGIPTITIDDFCNLHNISNNWSEIKNICTVYNFLPDASYINLTNESQIDKKYTKNRQIINIDNTPNNIFFDHNLLGTFYSLIYDYHMLDLVKYVKRHIHYKEDIFTKANVIVEYLNTTYTNYHALHIRRTDFKCAYKQVCIPMNMICNNIRELIPLGSCVYISTDSKNKDEFQELREKYRLVFFEDVAHLLNTEYNTDLDGLLEQIICARSVKFIGTHLSTFSCYIYRLRGYMNDISDKNYYINTHYYTHQRHDDTKIQLGWKYDWSSNDNIWSREFIDGFDLDLCQYKYSYKYKDFYLNYVKFINRQPQQQKKIISFSLYGTNTPYSKTRGFYKGILVNYHLAKTIYPDWIIRVYMPYDEPAHLINELAQFTDIEIVLVDTNICLRALRFLPYDNSDVAVWLSRDLDSVVNAREKAAVDDWLTNHSTKELHIMTDNSQHYWTIAGGMFGVQNNISNRSVSTSIVDFILQFSNKVSDNNNYAIDCEICEQFFYKEDNYIQHYGSGKQLPNNKPFPEHAPIDSLFIGHVVDMNKYYERLTIEEIYLNKTKHIPVKFSNNDLFYYPPWNTNCIFTWYSEVDFTLTPIKTENSTSGTASCLKTENGDGIRLVTERSITILAVWDGTEQRHVYISDENTLAVIHGADHYYFTRVL